MEFDKWKMCYRVDDLIYVAYKRNKTRCELLSLLDDKNSIIKSHKIDMLEEWMQVIKDLEI